jgi:cell division protein FtsW (lipid II flippase)
MEYLPAENTSFLSQYRSILLAGLFVILAAAALTVSPAVRMHTWNVPLLWNHWVGVGAWLFAFGVIFWQMRRLNFVTDNVILASAALLTGWGVLTIYRIYPALGLRQSLWLILGGMVIALGLRLPSNLAFLRRYKYLWLTTGLALTAFTLLFGSNPLGNGPRLWLGCCGVYFQPSEPLKLLLIIFLAAYLADQFSSVFPAESNPDQRPLIPILAPTLLLSGIALGLLVVQRDLGTATVLLFLFATMTYLATGRRSIPIASLVIVLLIGVIGYLLFDLVQIRVEAWLNPWQDPTGRSYQIIQSLIAVANGGLAGRGPGLGSPRLVPVAHSDFIFSAISEEYGFIGVIGLLLVLGLMINHGLKATIHARNSFHRYLAAGLTAYLIGQSILIIGGNIRVLPLTGVTLPFVSYGGSSLLTSCVAILLLLHVARRENMYPYPMPRKRPYQELGVLLFAGLGIISLASGWWGIVRNETLISRDDNPRRYINDIYVRRGSLLDRANSVLTETIGESGTYQRIYRYADLGPVLGYTNASYGQSGLEASLDTYLRGVSGNPQSDIWWHFLVYGQHPPGLDVRLSLDEKLQATADELLADHSGAVVLMDAKSGEILVMASHPTFDANQLESTWNNLIADERAPLLNRATLGSYQPGTALGPLWLAAWNDTGLPLPALPTSLSVNLEGTPLDCAVSPGVEPTWASAIASGCPAASALLVQELGTRNPEAPEANLAAFGLYTEPQVRMPVSQPSTPDPDADPLELAVGQSSLLVNPLQIAQAASAISVGGTLPASRITLAVDTPQAGWVVLPTFGTNAQAVGSTSAQNTARQLANQNQPYWETVSSALNGDITNTWYLGGTLPNWTGSPLGLVVLLEEDNPELANQIGSQLLQQAMALP